MSNGRPIKKFVQLVTINNNYHLLSRLIVQRGISLGFHLGELTTSPSKDIYMLPNGLCRSFSKYDGKQSFDFIQKINFFFIDNTNSDQLYNFRDCIFPKKLYKVFTELEDKQDLKEFMTQKELDGGYDFCVFPNEAEIEWLEKKHQEAIQKEFYNYCTTHKINTREKAKVEWVKSKNKINYIIEDIIKEVNIDFIWKKQQDMKNFIKKYKSGDLPEDKLLWLNEQLENVSETLMNKNNYLWEKIENGTIYDVGSWDIKKTYGEKDTRNAFLVPAYRIYGHYALCCLEIFLDIQEGLPCFVCERCKNIVYTDKKTKQRLCSKKDNLECFREQENKRQRKKYHEKKKEELDET